TTPTATTPTATTPTATTPTATTPTATTPTTTTIVTVTRIRTIVPGPPVSPTIRLRLSGLFTLHGAHVSVPRRRTTVELTIHPYVTGQRMSVTESLDGRRFRRLRVLARCVGPHEGRLRLSVAAPGAGRVTVAVRHRPGRTMRAFKAHAVFAALRTAVQLGSRGRFVELVQQRLAALHLFIAQTGVFDQGTQLALDAYHRLLGQGEGNVSLSPATLTKLLDGVGSFHVRYPRQGEHAEGDLSDQVIAFIDGSQVHWIFPISSGKPSTPTIRGRFQVYYKEPEYTSDGMYFSSFFHGGYAIHGYDPAPDYPASHGCMRLPMADAIPAYGWMSVGDWVDTYYK
ncbi:MAG: L,D-transpeptidase, partial [Solirubrobacteraceae bacterium]